MRPEFNLSGRTDPLAVNCKALANVLQKWVDKFNAEHPVYEVKYRYGDMRGVGGINYLSIHSGKPTRTISSILKMEREWVTLDMADSLLSAAGYNINNFEELAPVPNPYWSREKWEKWQQSCEE